MHAIVRAEPLEFVTSLLYVVGSALFLRHDAIFLLLLTQTVSGDWGWPPAAAVWWSSCGGHRLAGLHLHQEGSMACATRRRETQVPQHCARGAGWNICGEVKGNIYFMYIGLSFLTFIKNSRCSKLSWLVLFMTLKSDKWSDCLFQRTKLWISDAWVLEYL